MTVQQFLFRLIHLRRISDRSSPRLVTFGLQPRLACLHLKPPADHVGRDEDVNLQKNPDVGSVLPPMDLSHSALRLALSFSQTCVSCHPPQDAFLKLCVEILLREPPSSRPCLTKTERRPRAGSTASTPCSTSSAS